MKRVQLAAKGWIDRLHREARAAWERRDLDESIRLLERAIRLNPADIRSLLQLGRVHGYVYDYDAAGCCFERAIKLAPANKKAEVLVAAGLHARDFYNTDIAERYYARAVREANTSAEAFTQLAELKEKKRQFDEAMSLVEDALRRDPSYAPALYLRAHLQFRAGKLEEAEQGLRPLVDSRLPKDVRVRAAYDLGAVLDRRARFDEAMVAFRTAKALLQSEAAPYFAMRKQLAGRVAAMIEQVSDDLLRQWSDFRRELDPSYRLVLLGGHPRSGTTLLEQVLDAHPDIASVEETNHFMDYVGMPIERCWPPGTPVARSLHAATRELLLSCRRNYFRASELCLGSSLGDRILVDKNPSLTLWLPQLVRAFPEIKFLIALRDPRDVVLSCYMQPMLPVQHVSSTWLDLDTAADEYVFVMSVWRAFGPRLPNPSLEVRYEEMVVDLESVARRVLQFLDVPWDSRVLGFDEHARQKVVRSPTYAEVTEKIFTRAMGRWRRYEKYLAPCLPKLQPFVKAFGYD